MKANELMQGYIVLYEYDGQKYPVRVIEIYRNSVLIESINGEYEPIEIEEDKIFPVSLTPEILEKNGFNGKYKLSYQYNKPEEGFALTYISYWKGRLSIRVSPDIRKKHSTNVMHINCVYVHQIQSALRLCRIEKTIEL